MNIELDDYERDNLLAALHAIAQLQGPQQRMNTGDWNMQVLYKLGWSGPTTDWGHPNVSAEEMAAACRVFKCLECEYPQERLV